MREWKLNRRISCVNWCCEKDNWCCVNWWGSKAQRTEPPKRTEHSICFPWPPPLLLKKTGCCRHVGKNVRTFNAFPIQLIQISDFKLQFVVENRIPEIHVYVRCSCFRFHMSRGQFHVQGDMGCSNYWRSGLDGAACIPKMSTVEGGKGVLAKSADLFFG